MPHANDLAHHPPHADVFTLYEASGTGEKLSGVPGLAYLHGHSKHGVPCLDGLETLVKLVWSPLMSTLQSPVAPPEIVGEHLRDAIRGAGRLFLD